MRLSIDQLPAHIRERLKAHPSYLSLRRQPRVFTDTSDFTSIDYGDVIAVDARFFLITGYTREGRFGVDEQPKQWVPRTLDLESGKNHILKLVFFETFEITLGHFTIPCFRSPEKEARIIKLVQGHERFMQGYTVEDQAGNLIRILDIINGKRLDKYIFALEESHRDYFARHMPGILRQFLDLVKAISLLHRHGLRHGDIRRDHVLVDYETGMFKWIDFDYDFYLPERPFALDILELGNLLMFIVGRGQYHQGDIRNNPEFAGRIFSALDRSDFSLLNENRIVNLRKLFPYIPLELNNIFMHFSQDTDVFYDTVDELADDLEPCLDLL